MWSLVTAVAGLLVLVLGDLALECVDVARDIAGGTGAGRPFDATLVALAAAALLGCAGWVWLIATATLVEALKHGRVSVATSGPGGLARRLVLAACGAAVVVGMAGPATATGDRASHVGVDTLAGLSLPDRATVGSSPPSARPATSTARPRASWSTTVPADHHQVRAGESLWSIAAARLPSGATDAAAAAAWRRIYAHNRELVGEDPGLITPGMRLHLPDLSDLSDRSVAPSDSTE